MVWQKVFEKANNLDGSQEKLDYVIKNQSVGLTKTSIVIKPGGISWWLSNADKRTHDFHFTPTEFEEETAKQQNWEHDIKNHSSYFTTAEKAAEEGVPVEDIVLGFFVSQPWSWLDQHTYWGERDRVRSLTLWIKGNGKEE